METHARVGDVFLVPLEGEERALGQLVSTWNDELYVAIFGEKFRTKHPDPRCVIDKKALFLALTLDAKLFHGDWPIIGNVVQNLASVPQPNFKVRHSTVVHIESRDRTFNRPATPSEAKILRYRTVSSPAVIEEAIRAHFGLTRWNPHFDHLLAEYAFRSSELAAGTGINPCGGAQ